MVINPRRACAARVTVVVLCVCMYVFMCISFRYRASGRGALGYRKFAKVFSAKKSIFKQFAKVSSRDRNPLYGILP